MKWLAGFGVAALSMSMVNAQNPTISMTEIEKPFIEIFGEEGREHIDNNPPKRDDTVESYQNREFKELIEESFDLDLSGINFRMVHDSKTFTCDGRKSNQTIRALYYPSQELIEIYSAAIDGVYTHTKQLSPKEELEETVRHEYGHHVTFGTVKEYGIERPFDFDLCDPVITEYFEILGSNGPNSGTYAVDQFLEEHAEMISDFLVDRMIVEGIANYFEGGRIPQCGGITRLNAINDRKMYHAVVYEYSTCWVEPFLRDDVERGILYLVAHKPESPMNLKDWQKNSLEEFKTWEYSK